jgi:hypothetical protein
LNNFVDEGYALIPAWALAAYGELEWELVNTKLTQWEAGGFIKVLKNPEHCTPDELCIEMLNFIDAEKPLPANWLSKTRLPPKWPHSHAPGTNANRNRSFGD